MNRRIGVKFEELNAKGEKAFIPFIMAADPDLETGRVAGVRTVPATDDEVQRIALRQAILL